MMQMSNFVRREVEQLQEAIFPFMKKTSRYAIWAFPLLGIALFNLISLVFFAPATSGTWLMSAFYALLGAIGMALLKESKINKKQVQKISSEYMIKRIEKSPHVPDGRKREYIDFIKKQPIKGMNSFVKFLNEEETNMSR